MTLQSSAALVTEVADLLTVATDTGSPISPVRHLIGGADIGLAYAVQQEIVARRLRRRAAKWSAARSA